MIATSWLSDSSRVHQIRFRRIPPPHSPRLRRLSLVAYGDSTSCLRRSVVDPPAVLIPPPMLGGLDKTLRIITTVFGTIRWYTKTNFCHTLYVATASVGLQTVGAAGAVFLYSLLLCGVVTCVLEGLWLCGAYGIRRP